MAKLDCKPGLLEELARLIIEKFGNPMDVSEEKGTAKSEEQQGKPPADGGKKETEKPTPDEEWIPTEVDKRPLEGENTPPGKRGTRSRSRGNAGTTGANGGTPGGSSVGSPPSQ